MSTIKVKTKGEQLILTQAPLISSGNAWANKLHFEFDSSWDEFPERYIVFYIDENDPYQTSISDMGEADLIPAMTEKEGVFYFGIWGRTLDAKSIKTSEVKAYSVVKGAPTDGATITSWDEFWASFKSCSNLFSGRNVLPEPPTFGTCNATDFLGMFNKTNVSNVTIDVSSAVNMYQMFKECSSLKTVTFLNFPKTVTTIQSMFERCYLLTTVNGEMDFTNIPDSDADNAFLYANYLKHIRLKENTLSTYLEFRNSPLDKDSVLSVLRACREISEGRYVGFSAGSYSADIQPQIMEAVNKGWTIAFGNQTFAPEEV